MAGCRFVPHGFYGMIVTVIITCGWMSSMFENGCSYSVVTGTDVMALVTSGLIQMNQTDSPPFVEVGFSAFRIPIQNNDTKEWVIDAKAGSTCIGFPAEFHDESIDFQWKMARISSFLALVLGGGAMLSLWLGICCSLTRSSWRWAQFEVFLAFVFQMLTFVWFQTDLCNMSNEAINATKIDAEGLMNAENVINMITTTSCGLANGAKTDILATCFWFVSFFVMCYYPRPDGFGEHNEDGLVLVEQQQNDGSSTRSMMSSTNGSTFNNKYNSSRSFQSNSTRSIGSKSGGIS